VPDETEVSKPGVEGMGPAKPASSLIAVAQTAAAVGSPFGGGVSDTQQVSAVSVALSLPIVERVFGDSKESNHSPQDSALMEPAAILDWVATDEAGDCGVSDLAFLQTPNGINHAAEWLPKSGLAPAGQAARQSQLSMGAGLADEDNQAVDIDNGDVGSFCLALARTGPKGKQFW
jgi:hypothetical protein